ncbi:MAG TPA: aldo/keto reductase [Bryobacteraceae bacterium]|nr:aldo/keto reductase [Bryobacteraceae bacterium]
MRYKILGATGLRISELGFGAAPLGGEYGTEDAVEMQRTVHAAIDSGINFFDTAAYYGRGISELRLGKVLHGRRQQVVLATKCARYDLDGFDFSAAGVRRSVEDSLRRLQTDYLDVLHIHDVEFGCKRQIVEETIPAVRKIQAQGKARFIGITGLSLRMLRDIATEAPVDCILSYCRYNLMNRDLDDVLAPLARERKVGLINASPLHMRMLSEAGAPPWHPAPEPVKSAARRVVDLCRSRGLHSPALALQFAVRHDDVASTLVGMATLAELRQNLAALEQEPDPDVLREIDAIVAPVQGMMWISGFAWNH